MAPDSELTRHEVNGRINELNAFLIEANVEPVPKLALETSTDSTPTPSELHRHLDYLDVPLHADSRVDTLLHSILSLLEALDPAP